MKCNLFLMLTMINTLTLIIDHISGAEVFHIAIFTVNCDMFFCLLLFFGPYLLKVIKHVSSKKCIFNENLKNNMQYPYQI